MKSPSGHRSRVEGRSSQRTEDLHNLIEPERTEDTFREAIEYAKNVLHPQAVHNIETANRRYFGEVGKERSRRTMIYSHDWGVNAGHEHTAEISKDAAILAANCGVLLIRSVHEPDLDPVFGPDRIMFNGRGDACEDFIYPPTEGAKPAAGLLSNYGECKTECRDYDTLVSAVLLAVKHHGGDMVSVRSTASHDSVGWQAAFELYSRNFPERELPWLDNWPRQAHENR